MNVGAQVLGIKETAVSTLTSWGEIEDGEQEQTNEGKTAAHGGGPEPSRDSTEIGEDWK